MSEDESETITVTTASDTESKAETESKAPTVDSETTAIEEGTLSSGQEQGGSVLLVSFCGPGTLSELFKNMSFLKNQRIEVKSKRQYFRAHNAAT